MRDTFIPVMHILLLSFFCIVISGVIAQDVNSFASSKTVVGCERNSKRPNVPNVRLSCDGGKVIKIKSANYGRTVSSSKVCPYRAKHKNNCNCVNGKTLDKIRAICNGNYKCNVPPTNAIFGDSCHGTYKYLTVTYTCKNVCKTGRRGILHCRGRKDGDYQSCQGCNVYATCSNGRLYDNRPCPDGLVWDDDKKRCEWKSVTCSAQLDKREETDTANDIETRGRCKTGRRGIRRCRKRPDGNYQSCEGCEVYASCSNGNFFDNRPCPEGTVWDDKSKRCDHTSSTCTDNEKRVMDIKKNDIELQHRRCQTGKLGIKRCGNRPDGDYQSCAGCRVYATCTNGILYNNRACPAGLVWDDNKKRCEYKSTTCKVKGEIVGKCRTGNDGIRTCSDMADGDYQSCLGCNVYASCSNEILHDKRPCPTSLVWDDKKKQCENVSTTCSEN